MVNKDVLNIPRVFITGASRSGTTLLSNLLQNHPNLVSLPEATFIFGLHPHFGNKNIKDCSEEFINALWIRRDYNKPSWNINEELLRNHINNHSGFLSFSQACVYCFFSAQRAIKETETKVVINKHPEFSWYLPLLQHLFPESKYIILIRDYRDRYLSIKENFDYTFYNHLVNGISWDYNYQIIDEFAVLHPQNFLFIKYEDLISNKEEEFKKILTFLNLSTDIDFSLFNKFKGEFKINKEDFGEAIAANYNKTHLNSSKEIINTNFNKWQNKLSSFEVKSLEYYCASRGLKYNYKPHFKITFFDKIKILFITKPLFWITSFIFSIMLNSFKWPLKTQGFIYQMAKKRANLKSPKK